MNERLIDVEPDDLRDGDSVIQTDRWRGTWHDGGFIGDLHQDGNPTYQRVERDPELPTTPGAVVWAQDTRRPEQPAAAYQLTDGIWLRVGSGTGCYPDEVTRVHAVLRDPGTAGGEG